MLPSTSDTDWLGKFTRTARAHLNLCPPEGGAPVTRPIEWAGLHVERCGTGSVSAMSWGSLCRPEELLGLRCTSSSQGLRC